MLCCPFPSSGLIPAATFERVPPQTHQAMALISLQQVSLAYGGRPLFHQISLQIEAGERLCLLGRNGAGKSTLMRLLNGEIEADDGEIIRRKGLRTARLEQEVPADLKGTISEVAAAGSMGGGGGGGSGRPAANNAKNTATSTTDPQHLAIVLSRLELEPDQEFSRLSGGLKRRVLLARALANDPELLLLDEPTNHLDLEAISRLEDFLLGFNGALLFVTHDRRLVRRLATRIVELDRGRLQSWPGDYDNYLRRREEQLAAEENANRKFDRKLAEEEAWIRQGVKARRTRNQGRVEALRQMRRDRTQRREQSGKAKIRLQETVASGKLVAQAKELEFAWPDGFPVVSGLNTTIMRGDKVGIIGPNGVGKTTLIRLLLGQLTPQSGQVRLGTNLEICYFDQHREQLDLEASVATNLADGRDTVLFNGQPRHIMGYLQDFLFTPERARSPVKILSGGEKNRLLLARLFTRPCNVLVMDEPTNDLDIETLELLEELLLDFSGTLLLVSHDRDFLNNVVTSTLVCEGEGRVVEYAGGYDDWLRQRRSEPAAGFEAGADGRARAGKAGGGNREAVARLNEKPELGPKTSRRRKLTFTEAHELKELPEQIEQLETRQAQLLATISQPDFYRRPAAEIADLQTQLTQLETDLARAYRRWEDLERINENHD